MKKFKRELFEWIQAIVFTLIIFLIYNFFFATTTVYSTSMFPTLVERDVLFMMKLGDVQQGDIVSFKSALELSQSDYDGLTFLQKWVHKVGERKNLIKRVIAGPGDTIEISSGEVRVNGEVLNEPYISSVTTHDIPFEKIPEGMFFVMGDNRQVSYDSRELGFVKREDILGKVVFRIFPLGKFGGVD